MNKKLLCAALLGGLSIAQVAAAQEFDDRWYLTGSAGFNVQDNDRNTRDTPFVGLGVGKFLNQNWSIDGELNYQNPNNDDNQDLNWSQYGASLDGRYFFTSEGRDWAPYILMGLGWQRSEEEFDAFPNPDSPGVRKDDTWTAKAGLGVQSGLYGKRVGLRAEIAYRADFDDKSVAAPDESWFGDVLASVGVMVEAYGSHMPLNQLATVSVPEPRLLSVQVWDKSMVKAVEKAIVDSNLGLSPATEGQVLRLRIPELNEERRKELVKVAHKYAEAAKVAVRHVRRDGLDIVKKLEKNHEISEDDQERLANDVQKATDGMIAEIDQLLTAKEKEILTV